MIVVMFMVMFMVMILVMFMRGTIRLLQLVSYGTALVSCGAVYL